MAQVHMFKTTQIVFQMKVLQLTYDKSTVPIYFLSKTKIETAKVKGLEYWAF